VYLPRETETIEAAVPRNATLDSLLRGSQLREELVARAVTAARSVFDPRQIRAGRPYRLVRSLDGLLREFEYQIDTDRFLRIISPDRDRPDVLDAKVIPYEKQAQVAAIDARLDGERSSLIGAIEYAGENVQLALDLPRSSAGRSTSTVTCSRAIVSSCCSRSRCATGSSRITARFSAPRLRSTAVKCARSAGRIRRREKPPTTTSTDDR